MWETRQLMVGISAAREQDRRLNAGRSFAQDNLTP